MSWEDRLKEAVYTAPSGEFIRFDYEDVSLSIDKKTTAFEFPDANGTYVQDSGVSGRRFPLRIYLHGENYDLEAETFLNALSETGFGVLEHPMYGPFNVVPFGTITRRDDLKTAANQAIFEVTFWETIGLVYPTTQIDPGSAVLLAVDEFNTASSEQFDKNIDIDTAIERVSFQNKFRDLYNKAKGGLQKIADTVQKVQDKFNAVSSSINEGIDTLIGGPLTLAFQVTQLVQAPGRAISSIRAKLDAYKNLARDIFGRDTVTPGNDSRNANDFFSDENFAATYITGAIISAVNTEFESKTEALESAAEVLELFDEIVEFRDNNYKSLESAGIVDTGESYQKLQEAVSITAGFLVQISFSLKQERAIVLDRDRSIIDLVAELYGEIDKKLDFFINTNDLTGDEIVELPKGRKIVYYV